MQEAVLGMQEPCVLGAQGFCVLGIRELCILAMREFLQIHNPGIACWVEMVVVLQMDISEDSVRDPGFYGTSFSRWTLSWVCQAVGVDLFFRKGESFWGKDFASWTATWQVMV